MVRADFTRSCAECRHVAVEVWKNNVTYYHCGADGRYRGYLVGVKRCLPYVPAWCPEKEKRETSRPPERP